MNRVAVVGGSNGGYSAAADFADQGFAVQWYVRTPGNHEAVLDTETVTLRTSEYYEGPRRTRNEHRDVPIDLVTTDLAEAVSDADVVVVPLPTTTQRAVASDLVPHLEDGQVVLLCPGNFGSYLFAREHEKHGDGDVVFAETPTLPYVTRKSGPGEVTISLDAVRLPVGGYPGDETDHAYDRIEELYAAAIPANDALDAALNNSNICVNATPTVMNAGAIECDEFAFNIHRHGVQDGVYEALMSVDQERVAVREALGYGPPHFTQDEYYVPGGETGEHFYGKNAREALMRASTFSDDPESLDDRYVHEDVSIAGVLLASVADYLGVETPTTNAVVHLAEAMMGEPFRETGRSLEQLGIADYSREAFETLLAHGRPAVREGESR